MTMTDYTLAMLFDNDIKDLKEVISTIQKTKQEYNIPNTNRYYMVDWVYPKELTEELKRRVPLKFDNGLAKHLLKVPGSKGIISLSSIPNNITEEYINYAITHHTGFITINTLWGEVYIEIEGSPINKKTTIDLIELKNKINEKEKLLNNKKFLNNAPAKVIDQAKESLNNYRRQYNNV